MRSTALILLFLAPRLTADGGAVQLHEESGPLSITVFASPSPLRAGLVDFSVLVQDRESLESVLDAVVAIQLSHEASTITASAAHAQAQNKLLYAATVNLPDPGDWKYSVTVQHGANRATVSGSTPVAGAQEGISSHWAVIAFAPLCMLIFGLHQFLSRPRPPA